MSEETKDTQELVTPAETTENTDVTPVEPTIAELTQSEKAPESVPLAVHLESKKEVKQLKQAIRDLETKVSAGASQKEVSADIASLGKKYEIDPDFLSELSETIRTGAKNDALGEVESVLRPLQEKEKADALAKVFNEHYSKAIESMPEYKDIVVPSVIKTLSLDPSNANKTFVQLIEETYGSAITGKRTIESTTPGGGKEPQTLDYARAKADTEYFQQVMASPKLKEEYNAKMLSSGF